LAQERVIEQKEFDSIYQKSLLFLRTRAYRSTTVRKTDGDSSPAARTSVYEFVPPDRYHSINTWTDYDGAIKKNESIRIGKKSWFRANDEPWRISGIGMGNGTGAASGMREIERVTGYKMTPGVKLETGTADLYQFTETLRFEDRSGFFEETTWRDNWFNNGGLLLKSEYSTINTRLRTAYKASTIYEYDSRITIKPPVVEPEKEL
jgi:hypothetical protein